MYVLEGAVVWGVSIEQVLFLLLVSASKYFYFFFFNFFRTFFKVCSMFNVEPSDPKIKA